MILIPVFIPFGIVGAFIASGKGYSFGWWLLYGVLLAPITFIHALTLKPNGEGLEREATMQGKRHCPHCAEFIFTSALECRFCGKPVGLALKALQEGKTIEAVREEIAAESKPQRLSRAHYPKTKADRELNRKRSRYGHKPVVPLPPRRKGVYPKTDEADLEEISEE